MKFTKDEQITKIRELSDLTWRAQKLASELFKDAMETPFTTDYEHYISKIYIDLVGLESITFDLYTRIIYPKDNKK